MPNQRRLLPPSHSAPTNQPASILPDPNPIPIDPIPHATTPLQIDRSSISTSPLTNASPRVRFLLKLVIAGHPIDYRNPVAGWPNQQMSALPRLLPFPSASCSSLIL